MTAVHETGLCEAIVAATLRRAAGRRVTAVRVRVGGHPVDPATVSQGIQLAAVGTVAEDLAVDLVLVPMTVRCLTCGHAGPVDDHLETVACRRCAGVDIEVSGSDEVLLESITVDHRAAGRLPDRLQGRPPA
jgi:hydrogenase nickel incorporation protein HypA/HybF